MTALESLLNAIGIDKLIFLDINSAKNLPLWLVIGAALLIVLNALGSYALLSPEEFDERFLIYSAIMGTALVGLIFIATYNKLEFIVPGGMAQQLIVLIVVVILMAVLMRESLVYLFGTVQPGATNIVFITVIYIVLVCILSVYALIIFFLINILLLIRK